MKKSPYIIAILLILLWAIITFGFNSTRYADILLIIAAFIILLQFFFKKKNTKTK